MPIISKRKYTGDNLPGFELQCIVEAIFDRFLTKSLKFYQKWSKIDSTMHYSSKPHCWKKKRDFLIIRSKVGGFLSLTVDGNEYFVGWKENLVHKYHQKWLPIICESRLMFHHIHPIIRSKVGGFLILSVANCEYFVC